MRCFALQGSLLPRQYFCTTQAGHRYRNFRVVDGHVIWWSVNYDATVFMGVYVLVGVPENETPTGDNVVYDWADNEGDFPTGPTHMMHRYRGSIVQGKCNH